MEPARLKIPKGAYAVLKSISQVQLENHFFLKTFYFLSNLYTHHGVGTYNPEIKSLMVHQLSQPSVPGNPIFNRNLRS